MSEKIQCIRQQSLIHNEKSIRLEITRDVHENFKDIIGKRKVTYLESESELIIRIEKEA